MSSVRERRLHMQGWDNQAEEGLPATRLAVYTVRASAIGVLAQIHAASRRWEVARR